MTETRKPAKPLKGYEVFPSESHAERCMCPPCRARKPEVVAECARGHITIQEQADDLCATCDSNGELTEIISHRAAGHDVRPVKVKP